MTDNFTQNKVSCVNFSSSENTNENQGTCVENSGVNGDIESCSENIQDRDISCDNSGNSGNVKNEIINSEDVFYHNVPSTGIAPTIPTSSQYGVVLVSNNDIGESTNLEVEVKTGETNYNIADSVSCNIKKDEVVKKTVCVPAVGSDRFKVVKIESTQPFKRGRWVCMDFSDQSGSRHFQAIVNGDVQENMLSNVGNTDSLNKSDNSKTNGNNLESLESFHSGMSNPQNNTMPVNGIDRGLNNSSPEQSVEYPVKSEGNGSQCQAQSLTQASSVQYTSSNMYSQSQSLPPQQLQQLINTNAHVQTASHVVPGSQHVSSHCQQEPVQQISPRHLHSSKQTDQPQTVTLKQVPASEPLLPMEPSVCPNASSGFQKKLTTQESAQLHQQQNMTSQQTDTPPQTFQQAQGQSYSHSQNIALTQQHSLERHIQNSGVGSLPTAQSHLADQQQIQQPSYQQQQQPHVHHQHYQQQQSSASLQQNQPLQVPIQQSQSQQSHQSSALPQQSSQILQSQLQQQQTQVQQQQIGSQQTLVPQQRMPSQQSQIQHVQSQQSQAMQNQIQAQIPQQSYHVQQQVQAQHSQQPIQTQTQGSQSSSITQQIQTQPQQNKPPQSHLQQVQAQQPQMTSQPTPLQVPVSQHQSQMHQQQRVEAQTQCQVQQQGASQVPLQQQTQFHMQAQSQPVMHQPSSQIQQCQMSHQSQAQTSQGQIHQIQGSLQNQQNLPPQIKPLVYGQPQQQNQSSQLTQLQPSEQQQSSQTQHLSQSQQTQVPLTMHQCQMKTDQTQMHQQQQQQQQSVMQSPLYSNSQIPQGQLHHTQSLQQSQLPQTTDSQQIQMQPSQSQQFPQQSVTGQQIFTAQQQNQAHLSRQQNQHILSHQSSVQSAQQSNSLLQHQQSVDQQPLQMQTLHSQALSQQHTFDTHPSGQHTITNVSHEGQQMQPQSVQNLPQSFVSHNLNVQPVQNQPQTLQQSQTLPTLQQYQAQPVMMQNASQTSQSQTIPISAPQSFPQSVGVHHMSTVSPPSQNQYAAVSQDGVLHQTQLFMNNENQQIPFNVGNNGYVNVPSSQNHINPNTSAPASLHQPFNIPQQNFFNQADGSQGSSIVSNISAQPHQLTGQPQSMCDSQNQFSGNVMHCPHSSMNQNIVSSQPTRMDLILDSQQQNVNPSQFATSATFGTSNQPVSQQNYSVVSQSQPPSDSYVQTLHSGTAFTNVISNSAVPQNSTPVNEYNPDLRLDATGSIHHAQQYSHMYANGSLTGSHQSYQSSIDSNITTCDRISIQSHFYPKTDETHVEDNVSRVSDDADSGSGSNGNNTVAIDNKIEQAMDLVKSHLMVAVREEVEVLKEKIAELMDKISQLEMENTILKANATPDTLSQLPSGVFTPHQSGAAATVMHVSTSTDTTQQPP